MQLHFSFHVKLLHEIEKPAHEQKQNSREKTKTVPGYGSFLLLHMVWGKNSWLHWVKTICSKQAGTSSADLMATRSLGMKSSDSWGKQMIYLLLSVSKDFMSYIRKKKNNHRKKPTKNTEKWEVILGLKGGKRILLVNPNPDAGTKIEKSHSPFALPKPSSNTNCQKCFNWTGFCKETPVCSFGLGMLIRKINFLREWRRKEFQGEVFVPSSQLDITMGGNSCRRRYQAHAAGCLPKMTKSLVKWRQFHFYQHSTLKKACFLPMLEWEL